MNIAFDREVIIPDIGEWSDDSIGDWLHPCHGPLPDFCGIVNCGEEQFFVALWSTHDAVLSQLELLWDDDPNPEAPIEEPPLRGVILQSYQWTIDADGLWCCNQQFPLPTDEEDSAWRMSVYRLIMEESVRMTISTTVGNYKIKPASALGSR